MFQRTQKPPDRALWWSESVIRNGGARHLASSSDNVFGAQYLQSQPVFVSLTALFALIVLYIVCAVVKMKKN